MPKGDKKTKQVLFVCAGNTCRSPMAADLAGDLLGEGAQVGSAGTKAENGAGPTQGAIQVMSERGLNIRNHRSRPLRMVKLGDFDVVIALTPEGSVPISVEKYVAHFLPRVHRNLLRNHGPALAQLVPPLDPTHFHLPAGEQTKEHQQGRLL